MIRERKRKKENPKIMGNQKMVQKKRNKKRNKHLKNEQKNLD